MNSDKTVQVMKARDSVGEALASLALLQDINGGRLTGRYVALARTSLEEANHWLVDSLESGEGEEEK